MDISKFMAHSGEKPLDNIVANGGFCGIFRKIACIGDSLSSGEFESFRNGEKGYHDYLDYSWGQYMARDIGCTVLNFSRGGMSAREYCDEFAQANNFWSPMLECQAYILTLGVNDVMHIIDGQYGLGTINDIAHDDYKKNQKSFAGWYAQIIQRYKVIQKDAKFFLMSMPNSTTEDEKTKELYDKHRELLYKIADIFDNCYVLDFRKYSPVCDDEFKRYFYLGGHLNAAGYRLTALMTESYIDYIIRNNPDDFRQIGFVGTPFFNENYK